METALRIEQHGPSSGTAMSYTQRQPTHRQNHTQPDLYKPSRSPLPPAPSRYPFPGSPQLQSQVVVGQLAAPPPPQQAPQTMPPSNTQQSQQQQAQQPQQRFNINNVPAPPQSALPPPTGYRDTYRQHRISLLHPDYGGRREILLQGGAGGGATGPAHHMDSSMSSLGQQPFKKIRLQDHKDIQPLRIDTRDPPGAYNPQVEAISPTFPDHIQQEDQAFRTTKDELLQQIGKVDREIAKTESQISILRKKMQELEESASKPSTKKVVEEDCQIKHQSLAQKIYADNRKKAQSAHATLDSLGPKVEWPIYNQPSDAPGYHENKRKHLAYKRRLLEYFKKRHVEKDNRNSHLIVTYSKMMQEWHRKVDKTESSSKRKTKEAKNREFFERVFPELRKQREDKERFNRVGARIKSEADMEEIMDNLQEQVLEDKKMRSYAVIPPIMLDAKERKNVFQNNNGHILDMEVVHKSRQFVNIWTAAEKDLFKEKYLQHPKNFYLIASCLEKKSVADCVQYYYVSKKTENYKQLLKRSRQRTRQRPPKPNAVVDNLPPGVVTRHQKEQQQQQQKIQQNYDSVDNNGNTSSTSVTMGGLTASTSVVSSTNPNNNNNNNSSTALTPTSCSITSSSSSPAPASTPSTVISNNNGNGSATNVTTANTTAVVVKTEIIESGSEENKCETTNISDKKLLIDIAVKIENTSSTEGSNSDAVGAASVVKKDEVKSDDVGVAKKEEIVIKKEDGVIDSYGSDQNFTPNTVVENKKKKERRKDKDNCQIESSEDESVDLIDKSTQGQCIVCGSQLGPQLQSRPLAPNQANLYGLREEQVPQNGRVCNTCRCKSVRSRYTHCPLPTCPNARGRVKRLRSFPQRLQELPQDVRDQLLSEFHVPSGVTKCCSACFNRIQRRLGLVEDWPEEEVNHLRSVLTEVGANWQLVGERLNKTAQQVRSFYATNRKRLDLESCLGDRKPTLTDEEESGSSTSSCEEPLRERHSSDTISAESPPVNHEQTTNPARKEDYDSSATETADEGQTPDHYQGSATITPVNPDGQTRSNTPPRSVKDIMIKVIEKQLKKSSGPPQPQLLLSSAIAPTISSILNDSNEVTIVSEYNLNNQPPRNQRGEISIAKLTPLIGATITAVQVPPQATAVVQEPQNRDDLVVMQVQDGREPENLTLDLSIKKNREFPPPAHAKHQLRAEPYLYHERKSPAVYASRILQPKLPSPKPANPKAGSITMGTPIINQPRYDGLLRQITPDPKMGSITQGTPIHVPGHVPDKRMYEYFGKRPPQPQNVQGPPQNSNFPAQYRQPYSVEQQLSRQIIMNDYITSQQMEKLGRRSEKSYYLTTSSPHRTPPPQNPQTQQQRQGVIQRHTRPHYPPPGHEALTSLVDVAVQQPSLPVPTAPHEGLGKTIADNILEQPHRFQIIQQQQQQLRQQQQRIEIDRRYHQQQQQARQQQVARNETSTLTAANLIDAIITHQINQSENTREVVSNNREPPRASDRLFQSFHREQPQQDNNGERSPSVISVDLDSDTVSKNLTVKELTDSVISHDFNTRQPYYAHQESINEQWKRRLQPREEKRSGTPQNQPQSQDERQIIRIAQAQKYPVEPVSPPDNNHWQEQNYRRYAQQAQPQPHISALDYVKNRIVEVMRTEDDKKESHSAHDRSDSPGDMVIDEEKHDSEFQPQTQAGFTYNYVKDNSTASETVRNEPEPLLDSKYEPLSDED